ncbi:heavy-metal-associated domain-containing protein [Candidatus Poribacteria bacterium]|nr:heavy-metal-associated domain-containing protein [Candidatus Poribacteria bacterium]
MEKTKLKIGGMSCQHCVKTVTDALTELPGVRRAKVNLRKAEAVVQYDPSRVTPAHLTAVITTAGFEVF